MRALALALMCLLVLPGCILAPAGESEPALRLGSTTSTRDSGLLDALVEGFERDTGRRVHASVAGTGEVLEKARRGDFDVVLTHSPAREAAFASAGHGDAPRTVMASRFLIAGPADDPARVHGSTDAPAAFTRIAETRAAFVSRGDESGTHDKERAIWAAASRAPDALRDAWYSETGAGQAQTLYVANERGAYALVDEPAWLRLKNRTPALEALVTDAPDMANPYAVMVVRGARDIEMAQAFADWLVGPNAAELIRSFEIAGTKPFTPAGDD